MVTPKSDNEIIANDSIMQYFQWLAKEQNKSILEIKNTERYFVSFNIYFKDKNSYITEQGWVTGTECWVCSLNVYNKVRVLVCRADLKECLKESVARVKQYLNGDDKWFIGINQEQIDKIFKGKL